MRYLSFPKQEDFLILIARIAIILIFLISGINKFNNVDGTIAYMTKIGAPIPSLTVWAVIAIEALGALVLVAGFYTRPVAFLFVIFTLLTAFMGHQYWALTGAEQHTHMLAFYKNVGLAGGFLLLAVLGPGRYSLDRK